MPQNHTCTDQLIKTDFLIIGSGLAGLRAGIELSDAGKKVTIVTKSGLGDSNTYHAQGGIAAVSPHIAAVKQKQRESASKDSFDSHIRDTMDAGDGLCERPIVESFVKQAYEEAIDFLESSGIKFSKLEGADYVLHQEGGHEFPRIYCVGDYTGRAIIEKLKAKVRSDNNITILEHHIAINLITREQAKLLMQGHDKKKRIKPEIDAPDARDECLGVYVLDQKTKKVKTFASKAVFLASGGAGRVFQFTTNPKDATGDGIAMAYRAGAKVANMEFFQFHPTVLYEPDSENQHSRRFLLTEALRGGEVGGILKLARDAKSDLVKAYHKDGSHATRDIVARAIDTEMKKQGLKHVWLDVTEKVTGKSEDYMKKNFPDIFSHCLEKGINIAKQPIPVIPAAHYTCGGVVVDKDAKTDIERLYAIGEVACTGLMGANRLASNSLPEAAIYGKRAVEDALKIVQKQSEDTTDNSIPLWSTGKADKHIDEATTNQIWDTARTTMMNLCGIDRNEQRLRAASYVINGLEIAANELYWEHYPALEIIELRNIILVSKLIIESALRRKESRGGHFRSDFPKKDDKLYKDTITINK